MKSLIRYFLVAVMCGVAFYQLNASDSSEPAAKRVKTEGPEVGGGAPNQPRNIADLLGDSSDYEAMEPDGVAPAAEELSAPEVAAPAAAAVYSPGDLPELSMQTLELVFAESASALFSQQHSFSIADYVAANGVPAVTTQGLLDFSNIRLTSLDGLATLPADVRNRVRELDLSQNYIESIPEFVFSSFPNLQSIDLRHNKIEELPRNSFGILPQVFKLDLSDNSIDNVEQQALTGLLNIHELYLERAFKEEYMLPPVPALWLPPSREFSVISLRGSDLDEDEVARIAAFVCSCAVTKPEIRVSDDEALEERCERIKSAVFPGEISEADEEQPASPEGSTQGSSSSEGPRSPWSEADPFAASLPGSSSSLQDDVDEDL